MKFCIALMLTKSCSWDCQMPFVIGRGFADVQIMKNVKPALSLEPFGIF